MYVAVLLVLSGWAIWFWTWALAAYALAVMIAFQVRVISHEEPRLARMFPGIWREYSRNVPRWFRFRYLGR
jgi:protein-S-isoprenylcysteine O-methyltransferase Ste14